MHMTSVQKECKQSVEFSRPDAGAGSCSVLQRVFPTQGLNPGLPHCRWILYQWSYKGRPKNMERFTDLHVIFAQGPC